MGDLLPLVPGISRRAESPEARWAKILDQTRCIGCHACTTACKSENEVPVGVTRTYVKSVDVGVFPQARRAFQVTRCNQCADAPCVAACPTSAMFTRPDGIVDFDKAACIGCRACMAACPYDAIFVNPDDGSAEKCNFCAHRVDGGLEPACVVVCPVEAIIVGDLNDPTSKVAQVATRTPVNVRRPEKDTRPNVFYRGVHEATLDPLAARRPDGGLLAWATQHDAPDRINAGVGDGQPTSSAAALVSYDIGRAVPWDWRVSAYTWTKSIAAGTYLLAAALLLLGVIATDGGLWAWAAPFVAGAALAATVALLIWDLEHPTRFLYVLTRPQWRSWLVRGGIIVTAYAAVLGLHLLASVLGMAGVRSALVVAGAPLALLTAVYTAFLFAQAKARDLWQSPLLPAHFALQAALAGAAVLLLLAAWLEPDAVARLAWTVTVGAAVHLLLVAGEVTLPHVTAHARMAVHTMVRGDYAGFFWAGLALVAVGLAAPWIGVAAIPFVLAGLLAGEHAYVQAGQSVPLA